MPIFKYDALDSKGKEVRAEIEALSNKEAISKIRKQGLIPTRVRSKGAAKKVEKAAAPKRRRGAGGKVKPKYIVQFARQLSTLQDAGLAILRSLRILEQQHKGGKIKRIIGYVADDIEGGATLSEALGKFPKAFNRLFVNMIAAGEVGGVLDIILLRLADFLEKSQKLKSSVKKAMVYPVVVLVIAMTIVLFLMMKIIPVFSTVLMDMTEGEGSLPGLTQALMDISDWLLGRKGLNAGLIVLSPFAIVAVLRFIRQFRIGRLILDVIKLRMPIIGKLTYKISVARWTRTLGTLIGAGVPILEALNITRDTAGNEVYAGVLNKVHHAIRQGDTFANPLRQSKTVDSMVVNMIDVGEETGEMDKMLEKIANNYDDETDVLVSSLMSLIEPIMVVMLGLIVGTIVIAMFLPMVRMITVLM
ncbi:MAG TPA: type II secretion system F family protein [Planctomycetes bacterium]|nr:type II secretion system F family protein [Planctomycetota bacterium]HIJ70995.1 type II secretion system F family protein [Planctomycetota bacterium]